MYSSCKTFLKDNHMGTERTFSRIKGEDIHTAYREAVSHAELCYGTHGYTGSIAESQGMKKVNHRSQGITSFEAELIMNNSVDKSDPTIIDSVIDTDTLSKATYTVSVKLLRHGPFPSETIYNYFKENAANKVIVGFEVIENTTKSSDTVNFEKKEKIIEVHCDSARPVKCDSLADAKNLSRENSRKGIASVIQVKEIFTCEAIVNREFILEIKYRKILKSTKHVEREWYAIGAYSS